MEGEQRGNVKIAEGLLRVGVTWEVIEAASGLTEAGLETLKRNWRVPMPPRDFPRRHSTQDLPAALSGRI